MRPLTAVCLATLVLFMAAVPPANAGGNRFSPRPGVVGRSSQKSARYRDFWSGYYGSRTFSYGGPNARPGYAPGPEPRVRIGR